MKYFISFILVLFFVGCRPNNEEIYQKESERLIKQALLDFGDEGYEEHMLSNEQNKTLLEILEEDNPEAEYRTMLKKSLQIENDYIFDNCNELSSSFKLTKNILGSRNVIYLDDLIKIRKEFGSKGRDKIYSYYPKGWFSVKPPIFNKNYDIAVVKIGDSIGGYLALYKFENNKWVLVKRLMSWIS